MDEYIVEVCDYPEEIHGAEIIGELVRCRDCKHYTELWYCEAWNNSPGFPMVNENGFCSYGERKDG